MAACQSSYNCISLLKASTKAGGFFFFSILISSNGWIIECRAVLSRKSQMSPYTRKHVFTLKKLFMLPLECSGTHACYAFDFLKLLVHWDLRYFNLHSNPQTVSRPSCTASEIFFLDFLCRMKYLGRSKDVNYCYFWVKKCSECSNKFFHWMIQRKKTWWRTS